MNETKQKLTLDRPAIYQIKVPGYLDESWSALDGEMTISVETEGENLAITTLTGSFDQAALHGFEVTEGTGGGQDDRTGR